MNRTLAIRQFIVELTPPAISDTKLTTVITSKNVEFNWTHEDTYGARAEISFSAKGRTIFSYTVFFAMPEDERKANKILNDVWDFLSITYRRAQEI